MLPLTLHGHTGSMPRRLRRRQPNRFRLTPTRHSLPSIGCFMLSPSTAAAGGAEASSRGRMLTMPMRGVECRRADYRRWPARRAVSASIDCQYRVKSRIVGDGLCAALRRPCHDFAHEAADIALSVAASTRCRLSPMTRFRRCTFSLENSPSERYFREKIAESTSPSVLCCQRGPALDRHSRPIRLDAGLGWPRRFIYIIIHMMPQVPRHASRRCFICRIILLRRSHHFAILFPHAPRRHQHDAVSRRHEIFACRATPAFFDFTGATYFDHHYTFSGRYYCAISAFKAREIYIYVAKSHPGQKPALMTPKVGFHDYYNDEMSSSLLFHAKREIVSPASYSSPRGYNTIELCRPHFLFRFQHRSHNKHHATASDIISLQAAHMPPRQPTVKPPCHNI